jgi:ankyrin repeat protein
MLLQRGSDINSKNNRNQTALHLAAYKGHTRIVIVLVSKGIDINIEDNDELNGCNTALHVAARMSNTDIARILLARGIRIDDDIDWYAPMALQDRQVTDCRPLILTYKKRT